jgi:hypothetical protein
VILDGLVEVRSLPWTPVRLIDRSRISSAYGIAESLLAANGEGL